MRAFTRQPCWDCKVEQLKTNHMSQGLYEQANALSTTVLNNEKNEKTDINVVNSPNMRKEKLLIVVSHIRSSCMQHLFQKTLTAVTGIYNLLCVFVHSFSPLW